MLFRVTQYESPGLQRGGCRTGPPIASLVVAPFQAEVNGQSPLARLAPEHFGAPVQQLPACRKFQNHLCQEHRNHHVANSSTMSHSQNLVTEGPCKMPRHNGI